MCQDVCCVGGAVVLSPRREISSSSDEQPLGPAANQVFVKNVFLGICLAIFKGYFLDFEMYL